jgi:chitin disaccharide deacetylase
MHAFAVSVRRFVANAARRFAINMRFGFSTLMRRGWNKIRRLAMPFRVPVALLVKTRVRTLAERLGYSPQTRLLIVHADDLGLAQSVNSAFISGLETGLINSGSAMAPSSCFPEIAAFAQEHPEADIGLHLTLTSERGQNRWAPVASPLQVPSLVDPQGYLLEKWTSETRIDPVELAIELRAQIEKAHTAGFRPTHLDSHQYLLQLSRREAFEVYLRIAREYHLPVLVSREWQSRAPYLQFLLNRRDIVLDRVVIIKGNTLPENWPAFYRHALEKMPPGVTEFLIHPGYDNEELAAFFEGRPAWGAAWRQRDFDFFTSDDFRAILAKNDIRLTTWRVIAAQLR